MLLFARCWDMAYLGSLLYRHFSFSLHTGLSSEEIIVGQLLLTRTEFLSITISGPCSVHPVLNEACNLGAIKVECTN